MLKSFVDGYMMTMWFIICCCPYSQTADMAMPHLCKFVRHGSRSKLAETKCDEVDQTQIHLRNQSLVHSFTLTILAVSTDRVKTL